MILNTSEEDTFTKIFTLEEDSPSECESKLNMVSYQL